MTGLRRLFIAGLARMMQCRALGCGTNTYVNNSAHACERVLPVLPEFVPDLLRHPASPGRVSSADVPLPRICPSVRITRAGIYDVMSPIMPCPHD